MRVLHVISCLAKAAGHSRFCMTLAERLSDRGSAQTIFTLPPSGGEALPDPKRLAHYSDGRLFKLLNISLPLGLGRQIAARALFFKPDVIHLHGGWHPVLFFGARVAKRMRIPVVLSLHGSLRPAIIEGDKRLKKKAAWWLYQRRLVDMADVIHVSSEAEREDLARLGYHKPVVVVPNGVEVREVLKCESSKVLKLREAETANHANRTNSSFIPHPSSFIPHPSSFILQPSSFSVDAKRTRTVLYLGRLHPLKGLELLIEAWSGLKELASGKPLTVNGKLLAVSGKSGNVCGRTAVPKETDYDLRLTVNGTPWQLVVAGPDEQGTLDKLIKQARGFGLTLSCQPLTVNGERLAVSRKRSSVSSEGLEEKEHERDGNKRFTAYRSPFTDIVFMGPVYGEEKTRLMASADVFVLPTRSENFGLAVAEALACGVPVITTKGAPWSELLGNSDHSSLVHYCESSLGDGDRKSEVGSQRSETSSTNELMNSRTNALPPNELARSGRAGWWIDIGVEPLVEALKEAMSLTDEERRAMGENGRRLVESKYQWNEVARRMAGVYEKCVNAGLR